MQIERQFNSTSLEHETKFEVTLNDYELYVIKENLDIRLMQIAATRDKCGISPDREQSEPNLHIAVLRKLANELGIELYKAD